MQAGCGAPTPTGQRAAAGKQVRCGVRQLKGAPAGGGVNVRMRPAALHKWANIAPLPTQHGPLQLLPARPSHPPHEEAAKDAAVHVALLRLAGEGVGQGGVIHEHRVCI